jgi:glycosyltransferase involved in cell wall biosynthesis
MIDYGKDAEKAKVLARKLGLNVEVIQKVPHENMNRLYWDADLVLGSFGVGQLDTVALEAMACGRPVIHHIVKKYFPTCPLQELHCEKDVAELIDTLLADAVEAGKLRDVQLAYVSKNHNAVHLAKRLLQIYKANFK